MTWGYRAISREEIACCYFVYSKPVLDTGYYHDFTSKLARYLCMPLWPSEVTCLTPDKPLSFSSSKDPTDEYSFIFAIGYSCAKYLAISIITDSSNYEKSFVIYL